VTSTDHQGVYVPPFNQRERIPQEAIDDLVRQIAEKFHPDLIILFGSYAYGTPRPDSDVDLLVVMDTPQHEAEQALKIRLATDYHFGLDLLVRKPVDLIRRIVLGDFFLREITQKGKLLYERDNR
jgi:predicted nucleotidyltransferase